jgi:hypothetical protein
VKAVDRGRDVHTAVDIEIHVRIKPAQMHRFLTNVTA